MPVGDGPVQVRIAIHEGRDAPAAERLAHYFARLKTPLEGKGVRFSSSGVPALPSRFLVCEDFGTRGLEGDTVRFEDPPHDWPHREDFYWFWRNIGRSGKTGDDLGRWGLGKTVYRAASRVGCMFGLTVRSSDGRRLVMGQAVLQIHTHDGTEYQPEGYWCGLRSGVRQVPLSIEGKDEVRQFTEEWRLTRTTEPGLSVVAPFISDELRAGRILQAVAVHFFVRILRRELIVQVEGAGIGSVTLTDENIERICDCLEWNGPKRTKRHAPPPIKFARECLRQPPSISTRILGVARAPEFDDESLPSETLSMLRHRFASGELVSLRVRIHLTRCRGGDEEGHLDVFVRRGDDGARSDSYYVREGMAITKINSTAARRGIQALVLVDPGPMATLLGDSEGPAHEDWDKSVDRPNQHWINWKNKVGFARRIVDNLVEFLTPPVAERDFDHLSSFFSIERAAGNQRQRALGHDTDGAGGLGDIAPNPQWFQIVERAGGFAVNRVASVPMPKESRLRISLAYDISRGNALKNWSEHDFRIWNKTGGLQPSGRGVKATPIAGNVVDLEILDENFSFWITGFDRHRDLLVRVDQISSSNGEYEKEVDE